MILVVTAVAAERDAVLRGIPAGVPVQVVAVGVGPAAAAAGTAWHLARAAAPITTVVSAGVAGGFVAGTKMGDVVVATRSVAADLGADGPDGFKPIDQLGFGPASLPAAELAVSGTLPDAVHGAVLTVSTVTGTAAGAAALAARYPDAVAEGMEGFGVATAALLAQVPFAEVRTISNPVGPRDRAAWRLAEALDALGAVGAALASLER